MPSIIDPTTTGYYFVRFISKVVGLQEKKTQTGIYLKKEKIQSHMHI